MNSYEDRPVVFTISMASDTGNLYRVVTKDPRGQKMNTVITKNILFSWMCRVTEELNADNYAVLFEVD